MNRLSLSCRILSLSLLALLGPLHAQAQKWTTPTPEELSMTEQKGAPAGAEAVFLNHEEITNDDQSTFTFYNRIKVLKDKGKEYAKVQLRYTVWTNGGSSEIPSFTGRTIHADGTILPMTDKPVDEMLSQGPGGKAMRKSYILPQPEVGSILEYRYTVRLGATYDMYGRMAYRLEAPEWDLQRTLYVRKAHYIWLVTNLKAVATVKGELDRKIESIAWIPHLPAGVEVKKNYTVSSGTTFELNATDIPALPKEESMPPASSVAYRVRFYYTPYTSADVFWKDTGRRWSEAQDQFIGPGPGVKTAVAKLIAPADTPEQKLRKLYAAVMELDNSSVERAQGGSPQTQPANQAPTKTTDDVLAAKRGSNDQINLLFIAMARVAGIKAYAMRVSNRDRNIFTPAYMTLAQLTDDITVVNLNGKDLFLDPGTRFCPFGHLDWRHAATAGLRQIDSATELASTPVEPIPAYQTQRVANLKMDDQGEATGTIKLTYLGTAGTSWRQLEATKGDAALHEEIKAVLKRTLPEALNIEVVSVDKAKEYEEPLTITVNVKGAIGTKEGSKIMLKADLFMAQVKQRFESETREESVYLNFNEMVLDAIRISFLPSLSIASLPAKSTEKLKDAASYDISSESTATSVTIRRNFAIGRLVFPVSDYPDLHSFYAKRQAKDQEPIIFTSSASTTEK